MEFLFNFFLFIHRTPVDFLTADEVNFLQPLFIQAKYYLYEETQKLKKDDSYSDDDNDE